MRSNAAVICCSTVEYAMNALMRPNENKMSDGWREGASRRVEDGISWKAWNQSCQPFAA
jgi:hypothetical protein